MSLPIRPSTPPPDWPPKKPTPAPPVAPGRPGTHKQHSGSGHRCVACGADGNTHVLRLTAIEGGEAGVTELLWLCVATAQCVRTFKARDLQENAA